MSNNLTADFFGKLLKEGGACRGDRCGEPSAALYHKSATPFSQDSTITQLNSVFVDSEQFLGPQGGYAPTKYPLDAAPSEPQQQQASFAQATTSGVTPKSVSAQELRDTVASHAGHTLILVWAPSWCGYSKQQEGEAMKFFKKLHPSVKVVMLDVDAHQDNKAVAQVFGVTGYPSWVYVYNNKDFKVSGGYKDANALLDEYKHLTVIAAGGASGEGSSKSGGSCQFAAPPARMPRFPPTPKIPSACAPKPPSCPPPQAPRAPTCPPPQAPRAPVPVPPMKTCNVPATCTCKCQTQCPKAQPAPPVPEHKCGGPGFNTDTWLGTSGGGY